MQRPVLLVLLLALLAVGCGSESSPLEPAQAAPPQTAELDWVEICRAGDDDDPCEGKSAAHLVFGVERFEVLKDGWRARDLAHEPDERSATPSATPRRHSTVSSG